MNLINFPKKNYKKIIIVIFSLVSFADILNYVLNKTMKFWNFQNFKQKKRKKSIDSGKRVGFIKIILKNQGISSGKLFW